MPWASENRGEDEIGIEQIAKAYNTIAAEIGARGGAGGAWLLRVLRLSGLISIYDDLDGTGANLLGTYLAAAVIYATIFERKPEGLVRPHAGQPAQNVGLEQILIPATTAEALDDIAWRTVREYSADK